ncbi:UrcA family protein [Sphingomonas sp. LT1P40]|uniref:UrcA family protein n=1 Tax=Alteristakelama amylovorans TaxID=3096166 RepID=UPI002FCC35C0
MLRTVTSIVALSACLASPASARDSDRYEERQIAVPAAGLDLSSDAGVDILAARIDHAVKRICGGDRRCREEAWESTEWQVGRLIDRAQAWRRLANERAAQLRVCRQRCSQPAGYYAPPQPAATTVIVIRN